MRRYFSRQSMNFQHIVKHYDKKYANRIESQKH